MTLFALNVHGRLQLKKPCAFYVGILDFVQEFNTALLYAVVAKKMQQMIQLMSAAAIGIKCSDEAGFASKRQTHNLTWLEHINYIYNKILKFTSIFYKIRHVLPLKVLITIYFAFVHSHYFALWHRNLWEHLPCLHK